MILQKFNPETGGGRPAIDPAVLSKIGPKKGVMVKEIGRRSLAASTPGGSYLVSPQDSPSDQINLGHGRQRGETAHACVVQ